jgi:hypothetical protein
MGHDSASKARRRVVVKINVQNIMEKNGKSNQTIKFQCLNNFGGGGRRNRPRLADLCVIGSSSNKEAATEFEFVKLEDTDA